MESKRRRASFVTPPRAERRPGQPCNISHGPPADNRPNSLCGIALHRPRPMQTPPDSAYWGAEFMPARVIHVRGELPDALAPKRGNLTEPQDKLTRRWPILRLMIPHVAISGNRAATRTPGTAGPTRMPPSPLGCRSEKRLRRAGSGNGDSGHRCFRGQQRVSHELADVVGILPRIG